MAVESKPLFHPEVSVRHLMRKMGIKAIYRAPRSSLPGKGAEHKVHPYLLRDRNVETPDEFWCSDIT